MIKSNKKLLLCLLSSIIVIITILGFFLINKEQKNKNFNLKNQDTIKNSSNGIDTKNKLIIEEEKQKIEEKKEEEQEMKNNATTKQEKKTTDNNQTTPSTNTTSSNDNNTNNTDTPKIEYFRNISYQDMNNKINSDNNFVLLVMRSSCYYCVNYKPKLEEVANENKLIIYYINTDLLSEQKLDDIFNKYNIKGVPTTLFFNNGEKIGDIVGNADKEDIIFNLKQYGYINQ